MYLLTKMGEGERGRSEAGRVCWGSTEAELEASLPLRSGKFGGPEDGVVWGMCVLQVFVVAGLRA